MDCKIGELSERHLTKILQLAKEASYENTSISKRGIDKYIA